MFGLDNKQNQELIRTIKECEVSLRNESGGETLDFGDQLQSAILRIKVSKLLTDTSAEDWFMLVKALRIVLESELFSDK